MMPTSTASPLSITTIYNQANLVAFIQRLHHEPRPSVSGGQWGYTAYHPQTGEEARPRKPSRMSDAGVTSTSDHLQRKAATPSHPSHPIRARESSHPTEQSERANQRASIAKRLPPLHSHTTPFDDGRPVSDSAAQHRASSTILGAAARNKMDACCPSPTCHQLLRQPPAELD